MRTTRMLLARACVLAVVSATIGAIAGQTSVAAAAGPCGHVQRCTDRHAESATPIPPPAQGAWHPGQTRACGHAAWGAGLERLRRRRSRPSRLDSGSDAHQGRLRHACGQRRPATARYAARRLGGGASPYPLEPRRLPAGGPVVERARWRASAARRETAACLPARSDPAAGLPLDAHTRLLAHARRMVVERLRTALSPARRG